MHAPVNSQRSGRWRRFGIFALGALVLTIAISACGSTESNTATSKEGASNAASSAAGKKVALVTVPDSNPWAAVFNKIVKESLGANGAEVSILGSAEPAGQVQLLNTAVAQHPSLIILEALDSSAVAPAIAKAKQQGITVINVDGRADPSVAGGLHQVLSDNEALGEYAAENLVEGLEEEGRKSANIALITGTAAMLVTQDRMKGFDKVMAKHPQYKVVAEEDANWEPVKSGEIATQLFAKYGRNGLQAAYGMADYMAVPIITAAEQAGIPLGVKKDGLIVTGGNCFKIGIEAIRAGKMYGTATEDPGTLAEEVSSYANKLLAGESVPLTKVVKEARVTSKTLSKYAAQCSKA